MSNQEPITTEGKTLKETAEAYLESLAAGGTKPSTVAVYKKAMDLAITHFGADRKLDAILLPQVGKFYAGNLVNKLPSGRPKADPTIKQIKRVFRQCLEFAQGQDWLTTLPIPKAEMRHARGKGSQPETEKSEPVENEAQADPQG